MEGYLYTFVQFVNNGEQYTNLEFEHEHLARQALEKTKRLGMVVRVDSFIRPRMQTSAFVA